MLSASRFPASGPAHRRHPGGVRVLAALIALPFLLIPAGSSRAQVPRNAREMLNTGIANLRARQNELLPGVKDVATALQALQQLESQRKLARRVIALDFSMEEFAGILMSDSYDEEFLAAVDTLAARFTEIDRDPPAQAAAEAFREQLGDLPPMEEIPAAYVVVFMIGRCLTAASSFPSSPDPGQKSDVEEIAVRTVGALARHYHETRSGSRRRQSDDRWHDTVIERLRCQTHHSSYTLQEARAGLKPDGSLYRRYVIVCNTGQESRQIDFDMGEAGVLTQYRGRQNIPKPLPKPAQRQPGVDP